jgi:hypothetical protein
MVFEARLSVLKNQRAFERLDSSHLASWSSDVREFDDVISNFNSLTSQLKYMKMFLFHVILGT